MKHLCLLLLALSFTARAADWPAADPAPLFLWEHALAPNRVTLPERPRPRACSLATLLGRAHFGVHNRMEADGGAFLADFASAGRVRESYVLHSGFTLELVLTPRSAAEDTRGWIVALDDPGERGSFVLAQRGNQLVLGDPERKHVVLGALEAGRPHHVVLRAGTEGFTAFINGKLVREHERAAPRDVPESPALVFGGGLLEDHDWRGTLEGVAWYPGLLSFEQIDTHAALWAARLAERAEPAPILLRATLLEKSSAAEASSYPRSLVAYRYRVEAKPEGSPVASEHVVIYHWGVLGGRELPILDRPLNETVDLRLLPTEALPILDKEHRSEELFDPDAEIYYALPE